MPRFAANLTMLFTELPFLDRFAAARQAGFEAVEFLFPYAHTPAELEARLREHALQLVLHNLPAGDFAGGERGVAVLPDRQDEFRAGVAQALDYAVRLNCRQLNCLVGVTPDGLDPARVDDVLVENLDFAARALEREGVRLLLEMVNSRDVPGFHLDGTAKTLALIDRIGSPNILLQADVYHMQVMEGDLARTLQRHLARIAHVQVADNPGRHEPGTGEINFPFLFRHLDAIGYAGWVGCEYVPAGATLAGLGWLAHAHAHAHAK